MKKFIKEKPQCWIAIWMALGAGIGVPLDNIAIGVGIGVVIGFSFFLKENFKNKKKNF